MKKFLKRYMTVLLSLILSLQFLGTPISALVMDIKEESTKKALAEEYQRAVDAVYESAFPYTDNIQIARVGISKIQSTSGAISDIADEMTDPIVNPGLRLTGYAVAFDPLTGNNITDGIVVELYDNWNLVDTIIPGTDGFFSLSANVSTNNFIKIVKDGYDERGYYNVGLNGGYQLGNVDSPEILYPIDYTDVPVNNAIKTITLTENCSSGFGVWMYDSNLDLNGYSLTVNGNMSFMTSNLNCTGSQIDFNNGALIIYGQFDFGQPHKQDKMIMQNPSDYLEIWGNFMVAGGASHEDLWTDGTIAFLGNYFNVNEQADAKFIYSTDNHKFAFYSGGWEQRVIWDNLHDFSGDNATQRKFNLESPNGIYFFGGYTPDIYKFKPELPLDSTRYLSLYRKGLEIGGGVNPATGNYTKSISDLSVKSPGMNIDFVRTYNSKNKELGSFGKGWDFNLDISKIKISTYPDYETNGTTSTTYYQVVLPDGSNSLFTEKITGVFESVNTTNTLESSGKDYIIKTSAQVKYYYKSWDNSDNYSLYKIEDVNGNILNISNVVNGIRTVTDSIGRNYYITYDNGRITQIEDPTSGRTVTYQYNDDNQLIKATNPMGVFAAYGYGSNGHLNSITDTLGYVTEQVTYLQDGKMDTVTDVLGTQQKYEYNLAKQLTRVKEYDAHDNLLKTKVYGYDENFAITSTKIYADGQIYEVNKTAYTEDDNGENYKNNAQSSIDLLGNVTSFEYDDNGNVIKTINPDGSCVQARFNAQKFPIVEVDACNNVVLTVYDASGTNVIKKAIGLNTFTDVSAFLADGFNSEIYLNNPINSSKFAVTTYQYDGVNNPSSINGLVTKVTDPEGYVTENIYYGSGNSEGMLAEVYTYKNTRILSDKSVKYEYNSLQLVSKVTSKEGYVKTFEYDTNGKLIRTNDYGNNPSGSPIITRVVYDELGRVIKEVAPNQYDADLEGADFGYDIDNTNRKYTRYLYAPNGLLDRQFDTLGNSTEFYYDAYGKVVRKVAPDGTQLISKFDSLNRAIATYVNTTLMSTTSYGVENRSFQTYNGNSATYNGWVTTTTTYVDTAKTVTSESLTDYAGRTVEESVNGNVKASYQYYANGKVGSIADAKGKTAEYTYGYLGLATEVKIPFNSVNDRIAKNTYYSNGKLKSTSQNVQDENSTTEKWSTTEYEYNSQGLLSTVILGEQGQNKNYTYHFYNQDGVKTEMYTGLTAPLTSNSTGYLTTSYEYDNWNRSINTSDSTGYNFGTAEYDLNGNVISSINPNGDETITAYDLLGRPINISVDTGDSSKDITQTFSYDSMGRLSTVVNNGRNTSYEYDGLGRIIFENCENSYVNGYTYVGNTNAKASVFSGVSNLLTYGTTYYGYDDEMRLSSVTSDGGASAEYTYDTNGNRESMTYGNGITVDYDYNYANLVTSIVNKQGSDVISQFDYIYNLDGSEACNSRTEDGIIETTNYQYDHLQRLTSEMFESENTVDTISYTFDDFNNRASMVVTGTENYTTTYDYTDVNGNYTALLQSETKVIDGVSEVTSYTYDAAGSQITKMDSDGKVQENIYNGFKQLLQVSEDGTEIASYSYNYGGMRNKKTVENQTIGQIWVGGQITVDANGYNAACYIRGAGLIAMQDYSNGQFTSPVYYLFDAHGNVVNLIDNEGEKIKTYRYDAFGVEKNPDENDTNPFRYCGEYFDKETGTIYLRARSYDPSIGRFITRDSYTGRASDPLSLNLYTYCANNPVLNIDPSGHSYGTLPDGTKMSINSNWDAQLFYQKYNMQNAKLNPTSTTKLPHVSPEQAGIAAPSEKIPASNTNIPNIEQRKKSLDERINAIPSPSNNEYYNTIDDAAIDFVLQYNKISIDSWCEYDARIDSVVVNGVTMYTLGPVEIGPKRSDKYGNPTYAGSGAVIEYTSNSVAFVHTHAQYYGPLNDDFSRTSGGDIDYARNCQVLGYVGTPAGEVLRYDPWSGETVSVFNNAPFDTNHPNWRVE